MMFQNMDTLTGVWTLVREWRQFGGKFLAFSFLKRIPLVTGLAMIGLHQKPASLPQILF